MAILSGTGDSYTLSNNDKDTGVGRHNREDLSDFITNISPTETPVLSGMGTVSATAVTHEWLHHSLASVSASNVVVEGNEATFSAPSLIDRLTNICQINEKTVAVTGTQDRVKKAGMGRELAYRVILHTKEIKRDLETAILQNTTATTGSTTVARQFKGIAGWITTNTAATITTAPAADDINSMLQTNWTAGGNPDVLVMNGAMKRKVSAISGLTSSTYTLDWNMDAASKKFSSSIGIWDGDFGMQRTVADRFDTTQTVKALEMDLWKMASLRDLSVTPLAVTGDNTKRLLNCEMTLECRAEEGNSIRTITG